VNIRWSDEAVFELESIFAYIVQDNEDAAVSTVERIHAAIDRAALMPYIGRVGKKEETRELVLPSTPYIVVYEILEETIFLVTILHGAQKWL
jgi:addiction module RelE/StbE family toxin